MKFKLLVIYYLFTIYSASGQVVSSSCIADDSILDNYRVDADRLALRKTFQLVLPFTYNPYRDSIKINKELSDTILDALISVYNATSLPARDTVVTMFEIHSFPDNYEMNQIRIAADSNLAWMQELKNGNIPTGNQPLDSLLLNYNFKIDHYTTYEGSFFWHLVTFISDSNYNVIPLVKLFDSIPDIYIVEKVNTIGDGNNIYAAFYADHIELIYSLGWGDCPSGCTKSRAWKFKVYFDCSVEYIGSYGNTLELVTKIKENNSEKFRISPNPFSDFIYIRGISKKINYSISDLMGKELMSGYTSNNKITNLSNLQDGIYFVTLKKEEGHEVLILVKCQ